MGWPEDEMPPMNGSVNVMDADECELMSAMEEQMAAAEGVGQMRARSTPSDCTDQFDEEEPLGA